MKTGPHSGDIFTLCNVIRETSFDIHKYCCSGHREQIYENALAHRLRKKGINLEQQKEVKVLTRTARASDILRPICWWKSD